MTLTSVEAILDEQNYSKTEFFLSIAFPISYDLNESHEPFKEYDMKIRMKKGNPLNMVGKVRNMKNYQKGPMSRSTVVPLLVAFWFVSIVTTHVPCRQRVTCYNE